MTKKRKTISEDRSGRTFGVQTLLRLMERRSTGNLYLARDIFGREMLLVFKNFSEPGMGGKLRHPDSIRDNGVLVSTYHGMLRRCYDPKCKEYKYYGGRGIKICDEWLGEDGLRTWRTWILKQKWVEGLSMDRINNDGPYAPENCQLLTHGENLRKTRRAILSMEKARAIREEFAQYVGPQKDFCRIQALKYNCTVATILTVVKNTRWQEELH